MENTIYIPYGTKKYPVVITKPKDPDFKNIKTAIYVECDEAWFSQEWDIWDLWRLIELIPELIKEKRAEKKQSVVNLRISSDEKDQIEKLAKQNWYKNISSYIRAKALVW